MRFLANENVPLASVQRLRDAGHDVAAIVDDSPGAKDPTILARAAGEARIILTFDRDYGELVFRLQMPSPAGVVFLRFVPATPEELAIRVLQLLAIPGLVLEGKFTVVDRGHVRQRALP
jgi:predicted nuclease of predicted toxin-antitoxin system